MTGALVGVVVIALLSALWILGALIMARAYLVLHDRPKRHHWGPHQ